MKVYSLIKGIKEYTLNHNMKAPIIKGIFLNSGVLGTWSRLCRSAARRKANMSKGQQRCGAEGKQPPREEASSAPSNRAPKLQTGLHGLATHRCTACGVRIPVIDSMQARKIGTLPACQNRHRSICKDSAKLGDAAPILILQDTKVPGLPGLG